MKATVQRATVEHHRDGERNIFMYTLHYSLQWNGGMIALELGEWMPASSAVTAFIVNQLKRNS